MLKMLAAALVLAVLPASAVLAQDAAAPAPAKKRDCKDLMAMLPQFTGSPDSTLETRPDGCVATNLAFGSTYQRWTIARLSLTGIDMDSTEPGAPDSLKLDAEGIAFAPDMGNAISAYILKVQQHPLDVHLAYDYDQAQKQMHLNATLTGVNFGDFSVSGTIIGFSPDDIDFDKAPDEDKVAIASVKASLANKAMVESFIVPMVASMTPTDGDPEKFVEDQKAGVIAMLASLPDSTASADSKAALTRFVTDFPHPRGKLDLDIEPTLPITAKDFDKLDDAMSLITLIGKIKVTAGYEH